MKCIWLMRVQLRVIRSWLMVILWAIWPQCNASLPKHATTTVKCSKALQKHPGSNKSSKKTANLFFLFFFIFWCTYLLSAQIPLARLPKVAEPAQRQPVPYTPVSNVTLPQGRQPRCRDSATRGKIQIQIHNLWHKQVTIQIQVKILIHRQAIEIQIHNQRQKTRAQLWEYGLRK